MIYDCFCFFNELDILELRLNILNDVVDFFVISESNITHTGIPKPYYFEENKERYTKFLHKIIHLKIEDADKPAYDIQQFVDRQVGLFNPLTEHNYRRDFIMKESIRRGLVNCKDNDIIISSDCDEIPNPLRIEMLRYSPNFFRDNKFITLLQTTYYYYLNVLKETNWKGSRIGLYKDLKDYSYNDLRKQENLNINHGGWHFSYMGGPEAVKKKMMAFSAQEMINPIILSNIENNMKNDNDPYMRSKLKVVPLDDSYPGYLLENLEKYRQIIK